MSRPLRIARVGHGRAAAILLLVLGLALTGCGAATPSLAPAGSTGGPSGSAPASVTAGSASASPPGSATAAPGSAVPSATTAACATLPVSGDLPSERLVAVDVAPVPSADRVTLTFARPVAASDPFDPTAVLDTAHPPFFEGASGQPLPVAGDEFMQLTLRGMRLGEDDGTPVYAGATDFRPDGGVLRQFVMGEAFEGQYVWIAGLAAGTCVAVGRSADGLQVVLDFAR